MRFVHRVWFPCVQVSQTGVPHPYYIPFRILKNRAKSGTHQQRSTEDPGRNVEEPGINLAWLIQVRTEARAEELAQHQEKENC